MLPTWGLRFCEIKFCSVLFCSVIIDRLTKEIKLLCSWGSAKCYNLRSPLQPFSWQVCLSSVHVRENQIDLVNILCCIKQRMVLVYTESSTIRIGEAGLKKKKQMFSVSVSLLQYSLEKCIFLPRGDGPYGVYSYVYGASYRYTRMVWLSYCICFDKQNPGK